MIIFFKKITHYDARPKKRCLIASLIWLEVGDRDAEDIELIKKKRVLLLFEGFKLFYSIKLK